MFKVSSKSSKFGYKVKKELQEIFSANDESFWGLVICNGHELEGTYPYVITHFANEDDAKSLEREFEGIEIEYIDIANAPNNSINVDGEIFECDSFEEERVRYIVCTEMGYPSNLVIC